MTIALVNGKGGTGKTTLSVLLGAVLARAGHDVCLADTDPQRTATRWIEDCPALGLTVGDQRPHNIVIVDTPPRVDSRRVIDAIRRADIIILVTSASPADLFIARATAVLIREKGSAAKARVLFNRIQRGTVLSRDLDEHAKTIGLPALKNILHQRQAYQHAVVLGWEALSARERDELYQVALEIVVNPTPKKVK